MDDQAAETTEQPLTRRELRRREEAARAALAAPEATLGQPPVSAEEPAAPARQPRSSPSGSIPQGVIDEAPGITPLSTAWRDPAPQPYDWQHVEPGTAEAAYVPPAVRYPSPVKRFFRALGRAIGDFFGGLWRLTKFVALTTALLVAGWNALTYLVPGFTSGTGQLLASRGLSNPVFKPFAPPYSGYRPPGTGAADGMSPPPGVESRDSPLGTPAPVPESSDSYAFLRTGTDQPFISYDPCRPIHYVVRPSNAPDGGDQMITEAVAAVSRATGFVFINDGLTNEAPSTERPAYQPERYGNRWAPVLFAWERQSEQPQFTETLAPGSTTTLGLGGSTAITVDDQHSTYVTGQVRLNAAALGTMSERPDGYETVTAVVKHELAHVVGLDHVPDPTQLMASSMSERIHDFAAGDLTGLAMLGNGRCRPAV